MNRISILFVPTIVVILLSFEGIEAQQKPSKSSKRPTTPTPSPPPVSPLVIPLFVKPGTSQFDIDKLVQQNGSLPFSIRFPKPERKSDKFHYPMLPKAYWSLHKKPEVPLVEPENELGFGFDF